MVEVLSCTCLSPAYCLAPPKVGPCRAAFPRWRYNAATSSCEKFMFGGCKPNKNNFLSEEQCLSACKGVTGRTHTWQDTLQLMVVMMVMMIMMYLYLFAASSERSVMLPATGESHNAPVHLLPAL